MLSNAEIIGLYYDADYDKIIDYFYNDPSWQSHHKLTYLPKSEQILICSILASNIELFTCTFTADNLSGYALLHLLDNNLLHIHFENIISQDYDLCVAISNLINLEKIFVEYDCIYSRIDFLKIILKYIIGINNDNLFVIFETSVCCDDVDMIDILSKYGYDIVSGFDGINWYDTYDSPAIDTFNFLLQFGIDLSKIINKIGRMYTADNNIDGINYCLNNGANANSLLKYMNGVEISTIKHLIELGADINHLTFDGIKYNLQIIPYLIDMGLDISTYIDKLILCAISKDNLSLVTYLINMGTDIHIHNEIYLYYAVKQCNVEITEFLLNSGADIHANNDCILLFNTNKVSKIFKDVFPDIRPMPRESNKADIFKLLIAHGATTSDPQYLFYYYIRTNSKLDDVLLNYFLEMGVNLNFIYDFVSKSIQRKDAHIKSMLELLVYRKDIDGVKLLLKYGADVHINNNRPLKLAIEYNVTEIVTFLSELESK